MAEKAINRVVASMVDIEICYLYGVNGNSGRKGRVDITYKSGNQVSLSFDDYDKALDFIGVVEGYFACSVNMGI